MSDGEEEHTIPPAKGTKLANDDLYRLRIANLEKIHERRRELTARKNDLLELRKVLKKVNIEAREQELLLQIERLKRACQETKSGRRRLREMGIETDIEE